MSKLRQVRWWPRAHGAHLIYILICEGRGRNVVKDRRKFRIHEVPRCHGVFLFYLLLFSSSFRIDVVSHVCSTASTPDVSKGRNITKIPELPSLGDIVAVIGK